ncbi:MAG: serine hydrolase [Bacteroidia bacterium]|nr:serine hydrolase [Bacteroidia bacterium]
MKHFFFFLIFLSGTSLVAQDPVQNLVDSLARTYLEQENGALVIGVKANGISRIYYYGKKIDGKDILPDSSDIFEIGGITETFTSILLSDKAMKGEMSIDGRLQDYLDATVPAVVYQPFVCKPIDLGADPDYNSGDDYLKVKFKPIMCLPDSSYNPQPVLLCYLASHTSGMPDLPNNLHSKIDDQPLAEYTKEDLYKFLNDYHIEEPIGFDYSHSNLGIALLGQAISTRMKKDYERILTECILDSLGMKSSAITLSSEQNAKLLQGHNKKGAVTAATTFKAFAPVLGLHSTPADMMKFLSANISITKNHISNVLDYTHNPRLKTKGNDETEIAMGWKINSVSDQGERMVWQSGMTNGFAAFIGFVETSHTGVFILSSKAKNTDYLGRELIRKLIIN